jgi:hypothetical protein
MELYLNRRINFKWKIAPAEQKSAQLEWKSIRVRIICEGMIEYNQMIDARHMVRSHNLSQLIEAESEGGARPLL